MLRIVWSRVFLVAGLMALAATPAPAQGTDAAPLKNLESAGEFRNITSTGVTKPPGRALDGASPRESAEPTRRERTLDRKIGSGICTGCN
ncbi:MULTISPECIES: hypothetical protein [unclassified Methylobacterium]|uniref:hypothetical protein n=1 Tax=unclassified Methylobacterium TaxID=2615210 RepID=UPI0009E94EFC|nr:MULTISPECIES: hypothetical protein [unclassified Methylobacterium]